jgi:hypothetical protein
LQFQNVARTDGRSVGVDIRLPREQPQPCWSINSPSVVAVTSRMSVFAFRPCW